MLIVLSEFCSCYQRILLRRKIGLVLFPEDIHQAVPDMAKHFDSSSQIGRQSYMLGILALETDRPWLTLADYKLFLQGWFQAERCILGPEGSKFDGPLRGTYSPPPWKDAIAIS